MLNASTIAAKLTEEARSTGRSVADLLHESVGVGLQLSYLESKALAALILESGDAGRAAAIAGLSERGMRLTLESLVERDLIRLNPDQTYTFAGLACRLEAGEVEPAEPVKGRPAKRQLVFKPMLQQLTQLALLAPNPAAGLTYVYAQLYGGAWPQRPGLVGKIAEVLPISAAVALLMEYAHRPFDGDPLPFLLTVARSRAGLVKSEEDEAEERQRKVAARMRDHEAWEQRMSRWRLTAHQARLPLSELGSALNAHDKRQWELDIARLDTTV